VVRGDGLEILGCTGGVGGSWERAEVTEGVVSLRRGEIVGRGDEFEKGKGGKGLNQIMHAGSSRWIGLQGALHTGRKYVAFKIQVFDRKL
jgi:hypothetical protein